MTSPQSTVMTGASSSPNSCAVRSCEEPPTCRLDDASIVTKASVHFVVMQHRNPPHMVHFEPAPAASITGSNGAHIILVATSEKSASA